VAFFVACAAGIVLVASAPSGRASIAAGIYATSLALLFGISALYHRPMWSPSVYCSHGSDPPAAVVICHHG
jgi:hemolysin III